jgi:hypothetical protein
MVSDIVRTIAGQLIALGLQTSKTVLVQWNDSTLKVSRKGCFFGVLVAYNAGTDLYDISQYSGFDVRPLVDGVYAEDLLDVIRPAIVRAFNA